MKSLPMIIVKKLTVNNIKLRKAVKKIYQQSQMMLRNKLAANSKKISIEMKTVIFLLANIYLFIKLLIV